ncbi:hypothetical protein ASU31_04315 [Pedobacter ginsenosidimutans]|uniref:Uncharacterized protein n=1 Tax=Pedobacter ginsenosidimutans TaxID=687842 RepID=A0A0T5VTQ3_9SPHI|nr:hypothetical protein [Pedobacter ginsenosidimutans]KRT16916.1 hypothetical protein ASU31_04315 [Pedobacter ginsenosidimutans]
MPKKISSFFSDIIKQLKPIHIIFFGAFIAALGSIFPPFKIKMPYDNGIQELSFNPFTLLGAFMVAFATLVQNWKSSIKTNSILDNTILQLQKLERLTKRNEDITEHLDQASKDIVGNITGGDSYVVIQLVQNLNPNGITLAVINQGKYPIRELQARIFRNSDFNRDKERGLNPDILSLSYNLMIELAVLAPQMSKLENRNLILQEGITTWNIFVTSLGLMTTQRMVIFKSGSSVSFACKISHTITDGEYREVYRDISKNFPEEYLHELG